MSKVRYTEQRLRELGMDDAQVEAILDTYRREDAKAEGVSEGEDSPAGSNVVPIHQVQVEVKQTPAPGSLKPTSLADIEKYKDGVVVTLPPFAEGQPFVARLTRPSMLAMVKSGKIPNSLLNQATSLFANGTGALNDRGVGKTDVNQLFDVIDTIIDAALKEPTLAQIRSVGMDLSDDQLMAIFSYTQSGVKALEQFRTLGTNS